MARDRLKYGTAAACTRCGQDIQWMGRAHGWRDRGGNQQCVPFVRCGEVMRPRAGLKHTVRQVKEA